jgi:hypothetical protein
MQRFAPWTTLHSDSYYRTDPSGSYIRGEVAGASALPDGDTRQVVVIIGAVRAEVRSPGTTA